MIHTPRLKYCQYGSGYAPVLQVRLVRGDAQSRPIDFLVDTGASFSFVQKFEVKALIDGSAQEQSTGAKDANGQWVKGIPLDVTIRLADVPEFPEISERIWICSGIAFNMLGQTFLEKVSAHFMNFPQSRHGRHFSLTLSPHQTQIK